MMMGRGLLAQKLAEQLKSKSPPPGEQKSPSPTAEKLEEKKRTTPPTGTSYIYILKLAVH